MSAGSETTATLLTAIMNHLLRYPDKHQKLKSVIRDAFRTAKDITMSSTASLPYLNAVIQEGLRIAPPAPTMLPRIVPPGGAQVCGHWLEPGVSLFIHISLTFLTISPTFV